MKRFRLTPMQEVMVYESMSDPSRYVTVLRFELKKPMDFETLTRRLTLLANRHEILRTSFVCDENGVFWNEITDCIDETLLKLDLHGTELTVTFHHALLDGWSIGILLRELTSEREPTGIASPFRYYAKWLEKQGGSTDWWTEYLGGERICPTLPHFHKTEGYGRRELRFTLENSGLLRDTALELKITAGRLIQAVWCMLTARYNGGKSVVCTVSAGRSVPVPGIMEMAGICVNTLPILTKLPAPPESIPFSDWLYKWSRSTAEAEKHGFCRLGDLLSGTMPHILSIDPPSGGEDFELISSSARLVTDFDAVFTLGKTITAELAYNACAYSDEAVCAVKGHFLTALCAVLENPQIPLEQIPLLTEAEVLELTAPNKEIIIPEKHQTMIGLWQENLKKHASRTALVCGEVRLTYADLSNAADKLSGALSAKGVGRETPVAILLARSERYVIAELAVWLAGGMFVPLDPDWPRERIQTILDEISPILTIDEKTYMELISEMCHPLSSITVNPQDAAYVIMTSGTTGAPKGVVIEHRSILNFCLWSKERYGIKPGDSCALELGFAFDGSFWSIWPALISGGAVHVLRDDVRFDVGALGDYCRSERITHLDLPVAMTEIFRTKYGAENRLRDLLVMVTGGEEVRRVIPAPYPLSNEYGPTECTVCCSASWLGSEPVTLGMPVPGMTAYILDEWGRLCPDGVIGQAYFSGVQVARGYLNAPELTKARFVENPFADGKIMYKTGDLMLRNERRELVFKGRMDNQVKLNGFRIELAEIENVLRSHEAVTTAAAFIFEGQLFAYAVGEVEASELNALIAAKLPSFMRPVITMVDSIPLTSSGKVFTGRPSSAETELISAVCAPVTENEKALISAVSRALGIQNIGTNHNYLELGGNSINAMRISFFLEKEGYALSAKQLIGSGTLAGAAAQMGPFKLNETDGFGGGTFIPLAAQQAMMFLNETAGPDMYAVTVKVNAEGLREDELKKRLEKAARLHDILRTSFETDESGQVLGRVRDVLHPSVQCDLRGGELTLRYHHIALDGHSVNMLIRELLYGHFPETAPSFAVFANRLAAQTERHAQDAAWWRDKISRDAKTVPLLPAKTGKKPEFRRITVCRAELLSKCALAARDARVTLAAFTLTAWSVVADALGGNDGSIFVPFAASCRDDENLMGMCAQAHPLVIEPFGDSFTELAHYVQSAMLDSISHWFVPQNITGQMPDYLFVFEDGGLGFSVSGEQNYDLIIKFSDKGELIYNAARLPDLYAQRIGAYLTAALVAASENRISILSEGERELVSGRFTQGRRLERAYKTAAEFITAAAELYRGNTALETEDETLTYSEIYTRAEKLSKKLNAENIGAGDIAAFNLPRSAEGIIAQIGITLSGAAFLPLDPAWPEERTNSILRDSGAAAIIGTGLTIYLTDSRAKVPSDTAYVIYTSGTTGKPKGVIVPQRALANQIAWAADEFCFTPEDKMLHYIAFTFDPSVWVIFTALASGAALSLLPENKRLDPEACARQITEQNITRCALPSAVAPDILRRVKNSRLRTAFLGGEAIRNLPPRGFEVINCYGPTETCVNAAFFRLKPGQTETQIIGIPVANTSCYVLDRQKNPCPIGVQGELFIGGAQLAHGYLNRPEETETAFFTHPRFGRLYRTGDRAAWQTDGTLTFLGRRDNQVKIRGHRVELSEIEHALCEIPGVSDAKVRYKDGAADAFIIASETVDTSALKKRLPSYMLPRSVTVLEAFPLTENGKVDFSALPSPVFYETENTQPLSQTETAVADAWKTALELAPDFVIKRGDNFNDLGGHSLLLFHVAGLLSASGINADIALLIEYPVLADLAQAISRREVKRTPKPSAGTSAKNTAYNSFTKKMGSIKLSEQRDFKNILITGGTGFLGSYLIREFYNHTGAVIHLPVRGNTSRPLETLTYYFGGLGAKMIDSGRLHIHLCDISKNPPDIGVTPDAIFHTAADIRHYAPEPEMYRANVAATEHMLSLAMQSPNKTLFAHISTTSAVNSPVIYETDINLGPEFENIYQRTKQLAELHVLDAGTRGLNYAIFRVGHVSPGFESGSVSRNWEINAMLRLINSMLLTELLPEQDYEIGYGYVDKTAQTIRLLSTPVNLANHVFHIDNPNTLRLSEIFRLAGLKGTVMPKSELTKRLAELSNAHDAAVRSASSEYLGRLSQGNLEKDSRDIVAGKLYMDATLLLLKRLGFEWPHVTPEYIKSIVLNLRNIAGGGPK